MTGAVRKDTKNAGCTAKIVRGITRTSDILVHFFQANLTDAQKILMAIKRGFTIPSVYVPIVREMYLDNKLEANKMYSIAPNFFDPEMRPIPTHPQYEHNPAYPLEYGRRIQKIAQDRVFKFVPAHVVEVMRSDEMKKIRAENMHMRLRELNSANQKKLKLMRKMAIPRHNKNNGTDPYVNKENINKFQKKYINHENVDHDMRVMFRTMTVSIKNDPINVKYSNQDDFVEEVAQETIPIVSVKTNITDAPFKTEDQKWKEFFEKWGEEKYRTKKSRAEIEQEKNDRNRRARLNQEAEDIKVRRLIAEIDAIQPVESGEEFDQQIMLKLKIKSAGAIRACSIDSERSLRITLSEEGENVMEISASNEKESVENEKNAMETVVTSEDDLVEMFASNDNNSIETVAANEKENQIMTIPAFEIDNQVPQVAEVAEVTEITGFTEVAGVAEFSEVAEVAEIAEVAEFPEVAEAPEVAEDTEFTEVAGVAENAKVADVAEVAEFSDVAEVAEAAEDAEVAEFAVVADFPEVAEVSKVAEVVEPTDTYIKDFGDVYLFTMSNVEQEIEVSTEPTSERTTDPEEIIPQSTVEEQSTSSIVKHVEPEKRRKRKINPWEEIVNDAEDIFIRNSAPQSYVSSTPSALEIEQMISRPGPSKKTFITINDESGTNSQAAPSPTSSTATIKKPKRGRPKKKIPGQKVESRKPRRKPASRQNDDSRLTQSGPLDGRKPIGRPRKMFPETKIIEEFADIVVQSSLAAPQPHQFPRPDLKPFQNQKEVVQKTQNFASDSFMTPKTITVPSPVKFARPDINRFVADCAAKSSGSKRKSVGSQDDVVSLNSIGSEGPPVKKSKTSSENDDEQQSSSSSVLPPPSARPVRTRRSYISKNNPKIRHRRTEALAASGELEGSSDDAISRTSSQSYVQNRLNLSVNSRTSSVAGDVEDNFEWITRPSTFGDPQPPPEVTIDEEAEAKPELPPPPPLKKHYRQSKKRQRLAALKEVKTEVEDDDVQFVGVIQRKKGSHNVKASVQAEKGEGLREPKIEDDDVIPVELPVVVNQPVEEENNELPKIAKMPQSEVTHWFTINAKTYQVLNELFFSDPKVFEDLVTCLLEDENNVGNTFKQSVQVTNRTTTYSDEFIKFLANSPRDGGLSRADLLEYGTYTRAMRMRCSLSDVLTNGLPPNRFFDNVEEVQDLKKRLDSNLPRRMMMNTVERELLNKAESIIVGRYIESTLKVATLSSLEWTTKDHVRRRFEMLLFGWREFLKKGGFLKVVVALIEVEEKRPREEFVELVGRILNECEANVAQAVSLFNMSNEELEAKIAADSNLTKEQLIEVRNDMSREKTESHVFECSQCKTGLSVNIYFSNVNLLKLHESMHRAEECTLCYDDCPNVLLHTIKSHWSILNEY